MKNEEGRMKNSVGTVGKGLIMSASVGLKGWRGGDTTLGRWGRKATGVGMIGWVMNKRRAPLWRPPTHIAILCRMIILS